MFYKSIKDKLSLTDNDIIVIDGRDSQPLAADPSPLYIEPVLDNVHSNHCRACKKRFADDSSLLMHVGRAKKCKPSYESEIKDFQDFVKRKFAL